MTKNYEQRKQANEKYLATMDRIVIRVPKEGGLKEEIQAHADLRGESVQAFILRAIKNQIKRDNDPSMYFGTFKGQGDGGSPMIDEEVYQQAKNARSKKSDAE